MKCGIHNERLIQLREHNMWTKSSYTAAILDKIRIMWWMVHQYDLQRGTQKWNLHRSSVVPHQLCSELFLGMWGKPIWREMSPCSVYKQLSLKSSFLWGYKAHFEWARQRHREGKTAGLSQYRHTGVIMSSIAWAAKKMEENTVFFPQTNEEFREQREDHQRAQTAGLLEQTDHFGVIQLTATSNWHIKGSPEVVVKHRIMYCMWRQTSPKLANHNISYFY